MYNSSNNFDFNRSAWPASSPSWPPGHNPNQTRLNSGPAYGALQSQSLQARTTDAQQSRPPYNSSLTPSYYSTQPAGSFHTQAPHQSSQTHVSQLSPLSPGYLHPQARYESPGDFQTHTQIHGTYDLGHSTQEDRRLSLSFSSSDASRPSTVGHGVQQSQVRADLQQSTPSSHAQRGRLSGNSHLYNTYNTDFANPESCETDIQPHPRNETSTRLNEGRPDTLSTSQLRPTVLPSKRAKKNARNRSNLENNQLPSTAGPTLPTPTLTLAAAKAAETRALVNNFLPKSLLGVPSKSTPELPIMTSDKMMSKTSAELRILSVEHCKGSTVPPALQSYFMCLYDDFDKALAINCINNQVSVDAVQKLWGQKVVRKGPNSWQKFQATAQGKEEYRNQKGVANGRASTSLSALWNTKTQAEKDAFKSQNQSTSLINTTADTDSSLPPSGLSTTTRAKNMSLLGARAAVSDFMIRWQLEANDMAATYRGDFVIIGVSTYLGDEAYQIVRATPRASMWIDNDKKCNPQTHVAAQFQSYVTGTAAGLLNSNKGKVDKRTECREALSNLISTRTKGAAKKWWWKDCEAKLLNLGYFVNLASNSKSQASDLMQESNQLTPAQARDILSDIADNNIQILQIEAFSAQNPKRKRVNPADDSLPANNDNTPPTPNTNTPPGDITAGNIASVNSTDPSDNTGTADRLDNTSLNADVNNIPPISNISGEKDDTSMNVPLTGLT
ncbi:uncharacterized protein MELLADRAFT_91216 [Melampsora larici-populina 98AG31]|uniref:Uncharacterized protein n=1 Tax=Melampsora larici-populina (strain 98AG31 / pathotype 3-4-7) TaxID=747676 RepID=F4RY82_MELLP|nr:uncharacterized protein MELLADRAFT_91216 [Melampsora larici-populina 98AG31]EGG02632.1 hypothetical protein MELLADRAFT_91216 [Melampsora larici-populina 98AG31]